MLDRTDIFFSNPDELAEVVANPDSYDLEAHFDPYDEGEEYPDEWDDEPDVILGGRQSRQRIRAALRDFDEESDEYLDMG